jgi:hypothetical protein
MRPPIFWAEQNAVSNDSSCLMHIHGLLSRQGNALKTIHLAEVLNQK